MLVTEYWALCVCGYREQVEAPDTYPPAWPVMIDGDGKHYACTRGCLMLLMADPAAGVKQIIAPLPAGMVKADLRLLELVALDYENAEIGQIVCLSPHTIKNSLSRIYGSLGARNRIGALLMAHAHGIINLPRLAQACAERANAA